jgi:hypothetical protein
MVEDSRFGSDGLVVYVGKKEFKQGLGAFYKLENL